MDEWNLINEADSKAELYPGHGKRTGTLQRTIRMIRARHEGSRIIGAVGAGRLKYARRIHIKYKFITRPVKKNRAKLKRLVRKHTGR